jgi:hypothetical protein
MANIDFDFGPITGSIGTDGVSVGIDVPKVPGVPALASYAQDIAVQLLTSSLLSYGGGLVPQWGIYLNGVPVVVADIVRGFDFRVERAISNYPIERGGFESYDKVAVPYLAKVQFSTGGDLGNRSSLLTSVARATDLLVGGKPAKFDIVTPEIVYLSCSISHYDYNRTALSGLGLLTVDVWTQEVREQNTSPSPSVSPSGASTQQGGQVQSSDSFDVTAGTGAAF